MKKISLIILGITFVSAGFAQGEYGATAKDSIKCIENLIYVDYLKNDPKLALQLWRNAYRVCPVARKSLYINGVNMYEDLANATKDETKKQLYVDTILSIYNQRIKFFDQKGYVLGQEGQTMLVYRPKEYEKIFNTLNESVELQKDKTQSGTLVALMYAVINMEKNNKKTKDDVVSTYSKVMNYVAAGQSRPKETERYKRAEESINSVTAPYLDCPTITSLAEKNFEENKDNLDWLKNTAKLLKQKDCTKEDIFVKIATLIVKKDPSTDGLTNLGIVLYNQNKFDEAIDNFKKAADLTDNADDKSDLYLNTARAYYQLGQYSSVKTYALKAAQTKSGWGEPYLLIGDAYVNSKWRSLSSGLLDK